MAFEQNDLVRVDALGSDGLGDLVNVYHFRKVDANSITDEEGIDDLIELVEALYTILEGLYKTIVIWSRIRVQNESQATVFGTFDLNTPIAGSETGGANARQIAAVANFNTLQSRVIGRKYWGPVPESRMNDADGRIGTGGLAIVENAIAFLMADIPMTNGTWRFVVRRSGLVASETPITASSNPVPAALGRRREGRGS